MKVLFQTSVNPVRQKTQAIIKKAFEQVGIEVELKAINPAVFFSSDPGNADALANFTPTCRCSPSAPGAPIRRRI